MFWQFFLQISYSFCVLELPLSPITSILSTILDNSTASFCLSSVAEHIVLLAEILFVFPLSTASISLYLLSLNVVCTTTAYSASGSSSIFSASSTLSTITAEFSHQPLMPITSGWLESPMIITPIPFLCF